MLLERRRVSRKTPNDGRLEISAGTAERLGGIATELRVELGMVLGRGTVTSKKCQCSAAQGASDPSGMHLHYFVDSPIFQSLLAGSEVALELDEERRLLRVGE